MQVGKKNNQKEEDPKWMRNIPRNYQEQKFNIDYNMLMFIVGQGRMLMASRRAPNIPLGPCHNCSGDHLIKDCPHPRQPRQVPMASAIPTLARYCLECGIKHLVEDCPLNPEKKVKATLNLLKTIPSSGNESEEVMLAMAVTRA